MCDACSDFLQLLASCKLRFHIISFSNKIVTTFLFNPVKNHVSYAQFFCCNNTFFISDEAKICNDDNEQPPLTQRDVHVVFVYIQTWPNR